MNTRGKFIVFEGLSGNGKSTQVNLLIKKLESLGRAVHFIKFPQYTSGVTGALIVNYLAGKYGDPMLMHPHVASALFAIDRLRSKHGIESALKEGKLVIADRYWPTNAAYQAGKFKTWEEREEYWKWLEQFEFEEIAMLKEDVGIFLRTLPDVSLKRVDERAKTSATEGRDGQEATDESQYVRFDCYERILGNRPNWLTVECVNNEKTMRSREEIHADIWSKIQAHI